MERERETVLIYKERGREEEVTVRGYFTIKIIMLQIFSNNYTVLYILKLLHLFKARQYNQTEQLFTQ